MQRGCVGKAFRYGYVEGRGDVLVHGPNHQPAICVAQNLGHVLSSSGLHDELHRVRLPPWNDERIPPVRQKPQYKRCVVSALARERRAIVKDGHKLTIVNGRNSHQEFLSSRKMLNYFWTNERSRMLLVIRRDGCETNRQVGLS